MTPTNLRHAAGDRVQSSRRSLPSSRSAAFAGPAEAIARAIAMSQGRIEDGEQMMLARLGHTHPSPTPRA
jgi:hypothetical protein